MHHHMLRFACEPNFWRLIPDLGCRDWAVTPESSEKTDEAFSVVVARTWCEIALALFKVPCRSECLQGDLHWELPCHVETWGKLNRPGQLEHARASQNLASTAGIFRMNLSHESHNNLTTCRASLAFHHIVQMVPGSQETNVHTKAASTKQTDFNKRKVTMNDTQ